MKSIILGAPLSHSLGRWYWEKEFNQTHKTSKPWEACWHQTTKQNRRLSLVLFTILENFLQVQLVCVTPLCKLVSSKVIWTWNASYQALFNKAKFLIKSDMCMKFYNDTKPLYLETDASSIGLGTAMLQTWEGTTCQKTWCPTTQFCVL